MLFYRTFRVSNLSEQMQRRISVPKRKSNPRDWDNPENIENPIDVDAYPEEGEVAVGLDDDDDFPRSRKRKRFASDSRSPSPAAKTLGLTSQCDEWTMRLKDNPKRKLGGMVADLVEKKSTLKSRLLTGIGREVPNKRANRPRRVDYSDDESDGEFDDQDYPRPMGGDMREKLNLRVGVRRGGEERQVSRRLGTGGRLKGRLGDIVLDAEDYDSGDSLERDDGADLKLDTGEAANMVIQVQQSDDDEDGEQEEDMEASENVEDVREVRRRGTPPRRRPPPPASPPSRRDVDHRAQPRDVDRRQPPRAANDLRHKVSSQVVKVKQEKAVEDRDKRER